MKNEIPRILPEDVFSVASFESLHLELSFKNLTSQLPGMTWDESALVELSESTLTLQVPQSSCNLGHQVAIEVARKIQGLRVDPPLFHGTGKIVTLEIVEKGIARIQVQLIQYEDAHLKNLFELYANRQAEISKFLESVRG